MESFDTKDCEVMESFDRKFEKFPSKDLELKEPVYELSESFDRKFKSFQSKESYFWGFKYMYKVLPV